MGIYEEIIETNKKRGGKLVRPSSLEFACDKEEKNIYKKVAYITRAIVVDHPFVDMNKTTAIITAKELFEKENIECNKGKLTNKIIKIAKENTQSIAKIERMLRKCCIKKK